MMLVLNETSSGKQLSGVTPAPHDTTTGESVVTKIRIGLNYSLDEHDLSSTTHGAVYRLNGAHGRIVNATLCELSHI